MIRNVPPPTETEEYRKLPLQARRNGNPDDQGNRMTPRTHPHANATYRVIPFKDGAFAVEVSIPETYPATISRFATEADAEAWIAEHQRRVRAENKPNRWFRGSDSRGANGRGHPGPPAGSDDLD